MSYKIEKYGTFLQHKTANNSATVYFTGLNSTFKTHRIIGTGISAKNANVSPLMQFSTDNGASWISSNTYCWNGRYMTSQPVLGGGSQQAYSSILFNDIWNQSPYDSHFIADFYNVGTANNCMGYAYAPGCWSGTPYAKLTFNTIGSLTTSGVNGINFYFSSGNIDKGEFYLFGINPI